MSEWKSRKHFVETISKTEGISKEKVLHILDAHDKADYELSRKSQIIDSEKLLSRIVEVVGVDYDTAKRVVRHLYRIVTVPPDERPRIVCDCIDTKKRLIDPNELFKTFECEVCGRKLHCTCQQEDYKSLGGLIIINDWRSNICNSCKGIPRKTYSRKVEEQYGRFFALHWREITILQMKKMKKWLLERTAGDIINERMLLSKSSFREEIAEVLKDLVNNYYHLRKHVEDNLSFVPSPVKENLRKEAENEIREKYGFPKIGESWISETLLYEAVKQKAKQFGLTAIKHARFSWLGRQHIDVFIPELSLGIEYMGEQHYFPVPYFGGEDAFRRQQKLDRKKRKLCQENGLELIDVPYTMVIDEKWLSNLMESKSKRHWNE